jgi:two-component system, response regulator PdtaR
VEQKRVSPIEEGKRNGVSMLFGKRKRTISRILVVEDEPLVAFDNEHMLGDAGYQVVATVDRVADALRVIEAETLHLVLADIALSDGSGVDVASAAHARGVPVLFVTGGCPSDAKSLAVGCLAKPYSPRDLRLAIDAVDDRLSGRDTSKAPPGLTFFDG